MPALSTLAVLLAVAPPAESPKPPAPPLGFLQPRLVGPAVTSGRVVGFAFHPTDAKQYFVAVASGGVWKTVNSGTTWQPVFDGQGSYSIGCVAVDPQHPAVVWVGTGENNSQRSVGYGDGVYKSGDGGRTWKNVGLAASEHVGKILIDPRDSDVVYVAAQGPLWGPGGDRGLYKTTDGGKSWAKVLATDENTGVTDVVCDPRDPDVLLAATYQRRRHVWTLVNGGPGSAVYRSTDAGKTWAKLSAGLPAAEMGRIGLAVSPADPDVVYATVEAADKQGGVFRSTDRGLTWERRNPFDAGAMYYGQIVADPVTRDRVYVMNVRVMVSDDGGKTLAPLGEKAKHVDTHALWVDPADAKHYLAGCDGGVYESFDRGATWAFKPNLPVTQFYDVAVDQNPKAGPFYHVFGGTQDNYTLGGPARTRSVHGITNADWYVVQDGDGFHVKVDPTDPDTVYAEFQYGGLCRYDRKTGTRVGIQPLAAPGEPPLRWNWDSPLVLSPHAPKRLYFAANKLFRSDDRGDTWAAVSGDLTRQLDRDALPVMGKVWGPDAVAKHQSTSFYGNVVALAESPVTEGKLWAGTDDGLVHHSPDGGKTWKKTDAFPGVPERTYVSKLVAGRHHAGTAYAAFDNHKNADYKPYLLKTTDAGATWKPVAGDLPARGTVYCVCEDAEKPDVLFCGTEFGLYVTLDAGTHWHKVQGLPTIQVKDLVIQEHNNDLVVGTFGRGIYVIDDITPLRRLSSHLADVTGSVANLFPTRPAVLYAPSARYGGGQKGFQGETLYTADNPAYGAAVTFHLKDAVKSRKQKRLDAEKAAAKAGKPAPYPSADELRAEAEEEAPGVVLTVADASGTVIRTLAGPTTAGMHRVTWDLREGSADPARPTATGPRVVPGEYAVTVQRKDGGTLTRLAGAATVKVVPDPLLTLTEKDYAAIAAHNAKLRALNKDLAATLRDLDELTAKLDLEKAALDLAGSPGDAVRAKLATLRDVKRTLTGDAVLAGRNVNVPTSVADRARYAADATGDAIAPPTGTQAKALADAVAGVAAAKKALADVRK